jgi:hypothetical protein
VTEKNNKQQLLSKSLRIFISVIIDDNSTILSQVCVKNGMAIQRGRARTFSEKKPETFQQTAGE